MSSAVIPHELVYEPAPLPLASRIRRVKFESSEGIATQGGISKIHIQKGRSQFMNCKNSWLNFSVNATVGGLLLPISGDNTNNENCILDPSGLAACISKIELYSDNQPVSVISDYNKIYSMLQVAQANPSSSGIRSLATGSAYERSGGAGGCFLFGNNIIANYGNVLSGSTATLSKMPMMSASLPLLGILGSANIPLSEITGGLTIHITWTNRIRNFIYGLATTTTPVEIIESDSSFNFTNVSFEAEITTMDDSSQLEIEKENNFKQDPIMWSDVQYYATPQTYSATELSTTQQISTLIPSMRWTSLQSLYVGAFDNKTIGSNVSATPFNLPHIFFDEWRIRVGGIEYPKNWIDTLPQMVNHTMTCYSNVSQSVTGGLMLQNFTSRNYRTPVTLDAVPLANDRGVAGINLESFPQILAISGLDTKTVDTEFQARIVSTTATTQPLTVYFLSVHNVVYTISDGVLRVSD